MTKTRIKICGITTVEDAKLSHAEGADYIGLIFTDSSRRVTKAEARQIREAVPSAMLIGVFQDASLNEVVSTGRTCGLNMIQLHGNETPEYCDALLSKLSLPVIKAFTMNQLPTADVLRQYTRTSYFMLDIDKNYNLVSKLNGHRDHLWSAAATLRRKGYRIFLAGGLNPENVREAVKRVNPFGIDVASGIEKSPGVKDAQALSRFIAEARS